MTLPISEKGMVINYSYLWHREAQQNLEEGRKNRPCAIILVTQNDMVVVVPITHAPPSPGSEAIEIPAAVKNQIGLDEERSWIVTTEINTFELPGYDLRPIDNRKSDQFVYGKLPINLLKQVTQRVVTQSQNRRIKKVDRTS